IPPKHRPPPLARLAFQLSELGAARKRLASRKFIDIATLPAASAQTGLNSLPEVEFAQLSQRDPNPLGERALSINPRGGNMARPSITFIILLTVMWRPRSQWRVGVALHFSLSCFSTAPFKTRRFG